MTEHVLDLTDLTQIILVIILDINMESKKRIRHENLKLLWITMTVIWNCLQIVVIYIEQHKQWNLYGFSQNKKEKKTR